MQHNITSSDPDNQFMSIKPTNSPLSPLRTTSKTVNEADAPSPTVPQAARIASGAGVALSGTAASVASLTAVVSGQSMFKNITSAVVGAAPSAPGNIELGSRGPQVTALKTLLRDAGFYSGAINDQMGTMGIEALKRAKLALKLGGPVDVAGPTTIATLTQAVAARANAALSNEPNHQFTLGELTPAINTYAQKYGVDPKLLAGIIQQESTFKNHIVHEDGTGHGLIGLDDNGLKGDFEKWSGMSVGSGANAASIPPEKQIEFMAKTLSETSKEYGGDQMAAAREWHSGAGRVNSAGSGGGLEYEQLVRGHMQGADIAGMSTSTTSLGSPTTQASAPAVTLTPFDVRAGSQGPQVTELKTALKKAGFYNGVINDQMGPDGLAALKKAKETLKLSGDPGVAGPTTMKVLLSAAASTSNAATLTSAGQVKLPVMAQAWETDCGLTSVAMIANGLRGTNTDSSKLLSQYGYSLLTALEGQGVKAIDHGNLRAEIATEDQAWQIFANAASKGHPVLFGANNDYGDTHWSRGAGHYMASTGVSEVNGVRMITFNDPNRGVVRTVPFNHLWNAGLRNDGNCVIECS